MHFYKISQGGMDPLSPGGLDLGLQPTPLDPTPHYTHPTPPHPLAKKIMPMGLMKDIFDDSSKISSGFSVNFCDNLSRIFVSVENRSTYQYLCKIALWAPVKNMYLLANNFHLTVERGKSQSMLFCQAVMKIESKSLFFSFEEFKKIFGNINDCLRSKN